MKAMIGVGVFDKVDMIGWMLEGIRDNFPKESEVCFYFEACKDDSRAEYLRLYPGITGDFERNWHGGWHEHKHEAGVHDTLITWFMDSDCDVLIIPHDDNRFQRPLIPDLERLWAQYGTSLGWISGRDGYDFGYTGMVRSPFSQSTGAVAEVLPIGEHREVRMMNTGPVVYFRHMVEKVGMPDADLPWFFWDDLSLRCHHAGLKNILLSMDCLHEKFGRVGNNPALYDPELVAHCLKTFNERWAPIYGRNPL